MDENVEVSACAGARFIQQSRTMCFQALHCRRKIRNFERDMMQAFAALLDEFRDH